MSTSRTHRLLAGIPLALLAAGPIVADEGVVLDMRYRLETVDQSNFADNAQANTLRVRLGYETPRWGGFYGMVDGELLVDMGGDYNSTDNGNVGFPVIADPDGQEINQIFLGWERDTLNARLGLQRINVGNQRFIGAVGFRQREQTFEAFTLGWAGESWALRGGYMDRAQRIFGADHSVPALAETNLDTYYVEGEYVFGDVTLTGLYMAFGNRDDRAASHVNLDLALTGRHERGDWTYDWRLEFADQSEGKGGSALNEADYSHFSAGANWRRLGLSFGQETLGGDGTYGFQTPLATLHKFNGFADQFLATPTVGLVDTYVVGRYSLGDGISLMLVGHDYEADSGGGDLGTEVDFSLSFPVGPVGLNLKYASYNGTPTRPDVNKFWFTIHYAL